MVPKVGIFAMNCCNDIIFTVIVLPLIVVYKTIVNKLWIFGISTIYSILIWILWLLLWQRFVFDSGCCFCYKKVITVLYKWQSDWSEAAMHHRVLWPPPAGRVVKVSCPMTQHRRWMEQELELATHRLQDELLPPSPTNWDSFIATSSVFAFRLL